MIDVNVIHCRCQRRMGTVTTCSVLIDQCVFPWFYDVVPKKKHHHFFNEYCDEIILSNGIFTPPDLLTENGQKFPWKFHGLTIVLECFRMFNSVFKHLQNQNKGIAFRSNCSGSRVSRSLDVSFPNKVF